MPNPSLQLQDRQFGQLTVKRRDAGDSRYWVAVCSCGREVKARGSRLMNGTTKACAKCAAQQRTQHGHARRLSSSPTYQSWRNMKQRCGNPRVPSHSRISYSPEWESFENFLRDMGDRPEGMTLDRINVFRGYEPRNCRWATPETQSNNRRNTAQLVYDPYGLYVVASVSEWAKFLSELTGNSKWTAKALRTIIDTGTMDLHHVVKGLSPELRAHERLMQQREHEAQEELEELQRLFDRLLEGGISVSQNEATIELQP